MLSLVYENNNTFQDNAKYQGSYKPIIFKEFCLGNSYVPCGHRTSFVGM